MGFNRSTTGHQRYRILPGRARRFHSGRPEY